MRGKDFDIVEVEIQFGITPAYAGKSGVTAKIEAQEKRITPAYAGKSFKKEWSRTRN